MVDYFNLYLPISKREIRMEISGPRQKEGILLDTLYFLDGQNAFSDGRAAFGRSIRATKCLSYAARNLGKRILGVAIHNSGSDLGRINEYSPFKITNIADPEWEKQNVQECYNFCEDFIHTIIPFIEKKYNVRKTKESRFIYGSSLAADTALYLGFKYKDAFSVIGAFSTATFLFEKEFDEFLENNIDKTKKVFLYVGGKEESDDIYGKDIYLNTSLKLHSFFKKNHNPCRVVIDPNGIHNEETWGNHLFEFISFIYYDNDVIISPR